MVTCQTLEEAARVPGVIHRRVEGDHVIAYQVGDTLPAAYLAEFIPPSPAQVAALVSREVAESLSADEPEDKRIKALILVILDEFNAHALKINAILTAIDNAATLAAIKTAVAAIQDYPQRSAAQIKTAVIAKIDAGAADG